MVIVIVICLVLLSAVFSGLTLGLLSLSNAQLQRKISLGDARAKKIYEVRKNGYLLLCTLLLGNVLVNTTLSIFLGSITTGLLALLMATGLIVVFGEILPQAVVVKHAMSVGSKTIWLVKIFQTILWPVAWPLAKGLELLLGKEIPSIWSKLEIERLIEFHEDHPQSTIDADEERIIKGALHFSESNAQQIMTPVEKIFALDVAIRLDQAALEAIKKKGYTRIPVYDGTIDNILGILYTKQLIGIAEGTALSTIYRNHNIIRVDETIKLDALLNRLVKNRTHMAFIYNQNKSLIGIVTLEDIVEEILRQEIVDEYDVLR